jgi:hypothetical protein
VNTRRSNFKSVRIHSDGLTWKNLLYCMWHQIQTTMIPGRTGHQRAINLYSKYSACSSRAVNGISYAVLTPESLIGMVIRLSSGIAISMSRSRKQMSGWPSSNGMCDEVNSTRIVPPTTDQIVNSGELGSLSDRHYEFLSSRVFDAQD